MPNNTKLTDDILNKIKSMAKNSYNRNEISKKLNIKRQTINYWCKKYNIETQKYGPRKGYLKYIRFLKILDEAYDKNDKIKLNKVLRQIDLHPSTASNIIKKNPKYKKVIRSKNKAISEDKRLSKKEAEARLPKTENSTVLGFENGKYKIKTEDGFLYFKSSGKICQGDPRNKSGTAKTLKQTKK